MEVCYASTIEKAMALVFAGGGGQAVKSAS
jgi:hypothetical protein